MLTSAGRINKLFGTEGGVMLSLYEIFPEDFAPDATPLFVELEGLDVPLWCERFQRRGRTGAVAAFADLDTARRAQELLGKEFRIDVPEERDDEFYLEDLVGFAVEAETFETTQTETAPATRMWHGRVADYYDSDANPLFELEIEGRPVLVPAVEEFIARIDFEQKTIRMILPEGLIDLQP